MIPINAIHQTTKSKWRRKILKQRYLYLMLVPGFIWAILFSYGPMLGLYMAFVDYKPTLGNFWSSFLSSEFVGFQWFTLFFAGDDFFLIMRNTLVSSLLTIGIGFLVPILIAVALNEVGSAAFKRIVQTASYMPYFISWVIAANIFVTLLSADGVVNELLKLFGLTKESVLFLQEGKYFWGIVAGANTWKEMGYSSIIYLAAIASINPELYEAAKVDGATRVKQIVHITLPLLKPTIVILLILAVGNIVNTGFDQYFLLGNSLNRDYSDVIDTYSFRYGIQNGMFSYASAVGLFKSIVAFIMVLGVNSLARRMNNNSLF
ncbi:MULTISPECIES: sugar ABC transporter permease [unclassified Cohnella]|uniref:ABC transporter permease n=1 Tax=unclassified Cohnella TaxID=2636738 RepID=UPI001E5BB39C|nr:MULTISPECIES: ABC transporter permease subunit [unclassified Cohnella]